MWQNWPIVQRLERLTHNQVILVQVQVGQLIINKMNEKFVSIKHKRYYPNQIKELDKFELYKLALQTNYGPELNFILEHTTNQAFINFVENFREFMGYIKK